MSFLDTLFGTWPKVLEVMVTDVTRMGGDKVCIAASADGKAIRLHEHHPREEWLNSIGGLSPGDIVAVEWRPARSYRRPHSEDGRWSPASFVRVRRLRVGDVTDNMAPTAFPSVEKAFGKPIFLTEKGNPAFRPGQGSRSLATLVAKEVSVYPHSEGVRIDFADAKRPWSMVPVEDLRIRRHQEACKECSLRLGEFLKRQFETDTAILRIGLGRPYQGGKNPLGCHLQVNHIFPLPALAGHFSSDKEGV
ncbi:MAG: hypothetical protein ACRD1T_01880 [Acidimicrobiia bacterium]